MPITTAELSQDVADTLDWHDANFTAPEGSRNTYQWVRTEGVVFTDAVRSPEHWRGPQGHCFEWAQMLANAQPTMTYCEGFACYKGGPLREHAWNITPEGQVLDPTWPEGVHGYVGIPLNIEWVRRSTVINDEISVVFSDWTRGYRYHRNGLPAAARPQRKLTFAR